jgi:predicted glycosyltransferase
MIELFPFGRRKFDYELIPLLEGVRAARRATKIVCSLRDILVSKRNQAQYEEEVCALMNRYFDLLLIHADPAFQRLEETFPRAREIKCDIRYTGYVAQKPPSDDAPPADEGPSVAQGEALILVTIGGGRVGHELLACAIEAGARIEARIPHRMHIVTGPHIPQDQFLRLQAQAAERPRVTIERYTTRLSSYLRRADLSISMAGYNTCLDLLTAGVRALVYPFTGHNNQEQSMRARKLERMGVVKMIRPGQLEPDHLAEEIVRSLAAKPAARSAALDLLGAEKTAVLLAQLLER